MQRNAKLSAAIFASCYALYYAATATEWHFIDNLDLLIHEAGHWIFLFFGEFLHVLMGSGFQILFPATFVVYFYRNKQYYSASMILFWVGFNIINVSVYAGDAARMQLPLLGGEHDWHWIFSTLNVLPYTDQIAGAMYYLGVVTLIVASLASIQTALVDKK